MDQDNQAERCYSIAELAELGGVTRRTVRYYVQRGLLPTPLGTGRGPHYTLAHLERLIYIRTLQEVGVPLAEVAARLNGVLQTPASVPAVLPGRSTSLLIEGGTWRRFVLADGVELHVRTGAVSLQPSQLAHLVEATRQTLGLQAAPYPSERKGRSAALCRHSRRRSNTHERHTAQLSSDVEPGPDPTPGRTH